MIHPMVAGLSDSGQGALIAGLTAIVVTILTWLFKKRPTRVGAYDNVQEDLNALRVEFRAYKRDQDNENEYTRQVIIHLDNEVTAAREQMAAAGIAVQPRPTWPPRPTRL